MRRWKEGHVPCPCQNCIDDKTAATEKSDKETFDLLSNNDGLAIQTLDNHSVDLLTSTFSGSSQAGGQDSSAGDKMVDNETEILFEDDKMIENVSNISFENQSSSAGKEEGNEMKSQSSTWTTKQVRI